MIERELGEYVDIWWQAVDDFTRLLEGVPAEAWSTPTDLPGWDVQALLAHTAHLESLLAGDEHVETDIGDAPHARGMMGQFTEQGIVHRRDRTPDELINELRSAATTRHTALLADPPRDPDAPAPGVFGAIGWDTRRLLKNRPLDVWMHEQDARRALGVPGGLDTAAAEHTVDYLTDSMGLVLAKRCAAPTGTTLVVRVSGHAPRAFTVGDDGRGHELDALPGDADVVLDLDRESFAVLAGGRRTPESVTVEVSGDQELGRRIVASMAVTP